MNNNRNFPKNRNKPYNDLYKDNRQQNYPDGNFYNDNNYAPNEYNQQNDYLNREQYYQQSQNNYDNNQNPYYPQHQYPQYPPHIDSFPNQQPQYQGYPYGQFPPQYDPRFQQYPPQQPYPQNLPQSYFPQPNVDRFPNQYPQQPNNQYGQFPPQYDPRFQQYPPQQPYPQNPYQNYPYPQQLQTPPQGQKPPVQKYPNQPQHNRPYGTNSLRPMNNPPFFGENYYEKQYKDNYLNSPKNLQQNDKPFVQEPKFGRPEFMYNSAYPQPVVKPFVPVVEEPVSKPQIKEEFVEEKQIVPLVEETSIEKVPVVEEKPVDKPELVVEEPKVEPKLVEEITNEKPLEETKVIEEKPVDKPEIVTEKQQEVAVVEPQVQKPYNPFEGQTQSRYSLPKPPSAFNVSVPLPQMQQPSGQPQIEPASNIKLKYEQPGFNPNSVSSNQANSNLYNKVTLKNKLDNMSESKREEFEKSMGVKFVNSEQMPSRKNKGTLLGFSVFLGIGDRFYAGRWFLGALKFLLMIISIGLAGVFVFGFFDKYEIAGFPDAEFVGSVLLAIFASIWVIWYVVDILLAYLGKQKDSQGRNIDI